MENKAMTKALKTRRQAEFVTNEEHRLIEIEEARLAVKFGNKKRFSAREIRGDLPGARRRRPRRRRSARPRRDRGGVSEAQRRRRGRGGEARPRRLNRQCSINHANPCCTIGRKAAPLA
jgi:hypothetical protein